jgi:predicted permease
VKISRMSLAATINRESGLRVASRSWLKSSLVVTEIAISLVLLICASLIVRGFEKTRNINPGFRSEHALLLTIDLKGDGYDKQKGLAFSKRLLESVRAVSGVEEATLTWQSPLSGFGPAAPSAGITVEGYVPPKGADTMVFHYNSVGPDYLHSMGIKLAEGREFSESDDADSLPVVIVNKTMARRFWEGQSPIGRRISTAGIDRTIIGIADDSKYLSMSEDPQSYFYLPYFQAYQPQVTLQVRSAGAPLGLQGILQDTIQRLDSTLPVLNVRTLERQIDLSLANVEQISYLLTGAGLVGLFLSIIGVYGVMAQGIAEEMPSFGIRMALGACARDIFTLVLKRGVKLMLIGMVFGLLLSVIGTRFLRGMLFGVSPLDPATFVLMPLLLGIVIFLACVIPARRAIEVQPNEVLRYQ